MIKLALALVALTGLDNQRIEINPSEVVTLRIPRNEKGEHFSQKIKCMLHTTDGKIVSVLEDCETVGRKLRGE